MRTEKIINNEIQSLQEKLQTLKGRETEVYTRIVGYYRSVKNWNKGKREEYNYRRTFSSMEIKDGQGMSSRSEAPQGELFDTAEDKAAGPAASYICFTRTTCPNCPPVKNYLAESGLKGREINVDNSEGLKEAGKFHVQAAPTVILFDADGNVCGRAHHMMELRDQLESAVLAAVN